MLSGIGGIIGGYIMYFIKRGNYNPVIGLAAVSCVPTTAKVAQKIVGKDNPDSFVPVSYTHLDVYKRQVLART